MVTSSTTAREACEKMSPLKVWILAARPKTLPAAVAPVVVGTALALGDHRFALWPALAALGVSLLLQIGVNLANDYFDGVKGIDTPDRLGPVRVTQSGLVSPAGVRTAVSIVFGAAMVVGLYLVFVGGWPVLATGTACLLAALAYSGGPYPLASHGLGDLFALIFFGWVAVCGTYYVQALQVTGMAFLAATQVGLLITAILVVNNLRDIHTDRRCGKITLAVILGERGSKMEYILLLIGAYVPLPILWWGGWKNAWILLPLLSLPLAVILGRKFFQSTGGPQLNDMLAATAKLSLFFSCLLAVGLVLNGQV